MKTSRTAEFVLGLLGGIFGFVTGFLGLVLSAFADLGSSVVWIFLLAIAGIVGSAVVKSKAKLGGWIMLISGIGILICSSLFGLLPAILLIIGGLMALIKKDK